jgi:hypothetical protein
MATSIFFNGKRIVRPGAYSKIDASALQAIGPAATGIVALIGTAEGGKPLTVDDDNDLTSPDQTGDQYRSGDLKTGALFAFEPSQDDAVQGGPQRIVPVKVNPATQSTRTLVDANSVNSVDLTSRDYGQFTEQINIEVESGTNQGKLITVVFEDTTETFDDVGGDSLFSLLYTPSTGGFTTITGRINSAGFSSSATKAATGLVAERTADIAAPGVVRIVSSNAGDTTQTVTIYGLTAGNIAARETLSLNGTTPVIGTTAFTSVLGSTKSAVTLGTVTIADTVGPTTIITMTAGVLTRGVIVATNSPVADGVLTVSIDTNAAVDVAVFGVNASGATVGERFDMTAGTTPVVGSQVFRRIDVYALGDVAGARTVTVACTAVSASNSVFKTIQRLVDRLNALDGFTATMLATDGATFLLADADYATAVSLLTPAKNFYGDLSRFVDILNTQSQFVTAERNAAGLLVPANTSGALFLTGGSEGTTLITHWQEAFKILKKRRVTTIVALTKDPAVHSLLLSHLLLRAGALRSEANGYVGIGTSGGAGETLSNIQSQIRAINTKYISAISQEAKRFDPDTGEATWYPPYIFAAIAAGMQAGAGVGEPLTHKIINVLDIRQDSSWTVEDDADTLIDSGLMFAAKEDNVGIRWERSITTHLQDNNAVFTEMSAMESANTCVFNLRRAVEVKIGAKGLASSVAVIKGLAADELDRQVTDGIIVSWKPKTLKVEQIGDVFPISVEVAPILPINFIPITVHLVPFSAAA